MRIGLILLLLLALPSANAQTEAQIWSKVTKPTSGKISQSIGKYTSGCIRGAAELSINGEGYQVMRLSRKRNFGHPDLVRFIENLGHSAQTHHLGTLLIGDLGQPRGGANRKRA